MTRRVVAEIGSCQGDLSLAIDTAQAAIEAGAWLVKGQFYNADRLVTKTAPGYGKGSIVEPATQYEAFTDAFDYDEWGKVADAVDGKFFASVFDLEACQDYPYEWIKIASADITYRGLIEAAAATGAYLILSTGAATREEVNRALGWVEADPTLLVCTLSYPCELVDAHVGRVEKLRVSWPDTGYSDHTRGIEAATVAFELGATMVEKHFTITPGEGGDHDFAIGPDELFWLAEGLLVVDPVLDPMTWQTIYGTAGFGDIQPSEQSARQLARRSVHAKVDIPAGSLIERAALTVIRPADGYPPANIDKPGYPIGRTAAYDIAAGDPITDDVWI